MNYKTIITNTLLKYHFFTVFYKKIKTIKAMQMYTPHIHLFCFSIVCVLRENIYCLVLAFSLAVPLCGKKLGN